MMNFIQRNIFIQLRANKFHTNEHMEDMTNYKKQKIANIMKNMEDLPEGEVRLSNPILNKRLNKVMDDERHAIDTSIESLDLLRIIIANIDSIMNHCISIKGIIKLGNYLRTKGDKVDFVKIDTWLSKLHIQRIAQFQGSILIQLFNFEIDEIPFVRRIEKKAEKLTLQSLNMNLQDLQEDWHFKQSSTGFVQNNNKVLRRNLNHSLHYFNYAPIETISHFFLKFAHSLSEIEE
ncbi:hypothetical protein SAMN05444375_10830 [Segatella baroniae B14]|nr:hypothetical protein PRRU23_07320 [Segatella bryantii]SDL79622.1 hypothetical protein SAMN04487899_106187 [Segatella bryantii]SDZ74594.1 hypothetical protein SAMN05216455_10132 [Segatella bryantii]SEQ34944.1 hypothetical protein SAMN05444375_10830 [Segatella baroniae B14]